MKKYILPFQLMIFYLLFFAENAYAHGNPLLVYGFIGAAFFYFFVFLFLMVFKKMSVPKKKFFGTLYLITSFPAWFWFLNSKGSDLFAFTILYGVLVLFLCFIYLTRTRGKGSGG